MDCFTCAADANRYLVIKGPILNTNSQKHFNTKIPSLVFLLIIIPAFQSLAQEQTTLTIYTEDFAPYNFVQDGKLVGINIEAVEKICELSSLTCKFELLPWNRAYRNTLEEPNTGLVSTSRNAARESLFKWIGPLASNKTCFFKRKEREDIIIEKEQDLLKFNVGISKTLAYGDYFKRLQFAEGDNLVLYNSMLGNSRAFVLGRLDLIVASVYTLPYQVADQDLDILSMVPVFPVVDDTLQGNFLALNSKTSVKILQALQAGYEKLIQTKQLEALKDKYQPASYNTFVEQNVPISLMKSCV